MIQKKDRVYVQDWFEKDTQPKEGDIIEFEMPSFCSGDYRAEVYLDNDSDPYIDKSKNYYKSCRDLYVRENVSNNLNQIEIMNKKNFRPSNLVRSSVEYCSPGLTIQEGEIFSLPNVANTVDSWQDHGASGKLLLSDCEPIKADIFSLKKLNFEQKDVVSWKGNGADHQPETSGTTQIDFVYDGRFTFRFEEWHYTDKEGKLLFENSTHIIFGEWYEKISDTIPMVKEIEFVHQLQNWFYLFTGEEITLKKDK